MTQLSDVILRLIHMGLSPDDKAILLHFHDPLQDIEDQLSNSSHDTIDSRPLT